MSNRPDWCPADVWNATIADAKERADWLVDAVAASTQNRTFLRGDPEEDNWATESILLNGEKAIRIAMSRAILAERERWELIEIPCCAHEFYMLGYEAAKATRDPQA